MSGLGHRRLPEWDSTSRKCKFGKCIGSADWIARVSAFGEYHCDGGVSLFVLVNGNSLKQQIMCFQREPNMTKKKMLFMIGWVE
jgi:hypothetical protein